MAVRTQRRLIRQALASLKPGAETFSMYQSALARSRADWLIGMNVTRLFILLGLRLATAKFCR